MSFFVLWTSDFYLCLSPVCVYADNRIFERRCLHIFIFHFHFLLHFPNNSQMKENCVFSLTVFLNGPFRVAHYFLTAFVMTLCILIKIKPGSRYLGKNDKNI